MAIAIQLDMFEPYDEASNLRKLVIETKESNRKTSRRLFAELSTVKLDNMLLRADVEFLKTQISPRKAEIVSFALVHPKKIPKQRSKNVT